MAGRAAQQGNVAFLPYTLGFCLVLSIVTVCLFMSYPMSLGLGFFICKVD